VRNTPFKINGSDFRHFGSCGVVVIIDHHGDLINAVAVETVDVNLVTALAVDLARGGKQVFFDGAVPVDNCAAAGQCGIDQFLVQRRQGSVVDKRSPVGTSGLMSCLSPCELS